MSLNYANSTITLKNNNPTIDWTRFNARADGDSAIAKEPAVGRCLFQRYYPLQNVPTPSLILVPSRYKATVLYSQLPVASLDFALTRATSATRVNSSGLIEVVSSNVPRLDYYTSAGTPGCPGLLIEKAATNVFLRSEDFSNAFWASVGLNAFGAGSVANSTGTLDPYGTNLADYIQEDTSNGSHAIVGITAGNVSGNTYTATIFAKAAERKVFTVLNNAGGGGNVKFDLLNGLILSSTGATGSIDNFGNGWYRCRVSYTSALTGNHNINFRLCDDVGNESYTGTGDRGLYIFGAQLEAGNVVTSYIPTANVTVTRDAEVYFGTPVDSIAGQTEGAIYVEVNVSKLLGGTARTIVDIGEVDNRVTIGYGSGLSNQIQFTLQTSAGTLVDLRSAATSTGRIRIAVGYQDSNSIMYVNGVASTVVTNSSYTSTFLNIINMYLGSTFAASDFLNDDLNLCVLYPNRLTNAQLQYLTTF